MLEFCSGINTILFAIVLVTSETDEEPNTALTKGIK